MTHSGHDIRRSEFPVTLGSSSTSIRGFLFPCPIRTSAFSNSVLVARRSTCPLAIGLRSRHTKNQPHVCYVRRQAVGRYLSRYRGRYPPKNKCPDPIHTDHLSRKLSIRQRNLSAYPAKSPQIPIKIFQSSSALPCFLGWLMNLACRLATRSVPWSQNIRTGPTHS